MPHPLHDLSSHGLEPCDFIKMDEVVVVDLKALGYNPRPSRARRGKLWSSMAQT